MTYTNNQTSSPSDSFPGLAALVTGGSPTTTGFWYDVTWNRALSPPAQDGRPWESLAEAAPVKSASIMAMDESIDTDLTQLDGGGGINPAYLRRDPKQRLQDGAPARVLARQHHLRGGQSAPVCARPGRTSIRPTSGRTGPSGHGVDDFYGPEINSIPVALPFAGCTPVPYPDPTPDDGWTTALRQHHAATTQIHVQAVLNQIDGYTHDRGKLGRRARASSAPTSKSVSVGEKLNTDPVTGQPGGYADVLGTPGAGTWPSSSTSSTSRSGAFVA